MKLEKAKPPQRTERAPAPPGTESTPCPGKGREERSTLVNVLLDFLRDASRHVLEEGATVPRSR